MKDPLGTLINAVNGVEAEQAMRALKPFFSGNDIIGMARKAGWLVLKDSELADFLLAPGYAPFPDDYTPVED